MPSLDLDLKMERGVIRQHLKEISGGVIVAFAVSGAIALAEMVGHKMNAKANADIRSSAQLVRIANALDKIAARSSGQVSLGRLP